MRRRKVQKLRKAVIANLGLTTAPIRPDFPPCGYSLEVTVKHSTGCSFQKPGSLALMGRGATCPSSSATRVEDGLSTEGGSARPQGKFIVLNPGIPVTQGHNSAVQSPANVL